MKQFQRRLITFRMEFKMSENIQPCRQGAQGVEMECFQFERIEEQFILMHPILFLTEWVVKARPALEVKMLFEELFFKILLNDQDKKKMVC